MNANSKSNHRRGRESSPRVAATNGHRKTAAGHRTTADCAKAPAYRGGTGITRTSLLVAAQDRAVKARAEAVTGRAQRRSGEEEVLETTPRSASSVDSHGQDVNPQVLDHREDGCNAPPAHRPQRASARGGDGAFLQVDYDAMGDPEAVLLTRAERRALAPGDRDLQMDFDRRQMYVKRHGRLHERSLTRLAPNGLPLQLAAMLRPGEYISNQLLKRLYPERHGLATGTARSSTAYRNRNRCNPQFFEGRKWREDTSYRLIMRALDRPWPGMRDLNAAMQYLLEAIGIISPKSHQAL